MKVTDYVAEFMHRHRIRTVFELSGGMITHLLDSLHRDARTRVVSVHHEQTAAFAAEAYGRMTGIPAAAMATSGPGATNLLTGIGSAYFDSSPALFITGQVNRSEQKGERAIRQLGFQETDIVTMARPITKWAVLVEDAASVPAILERAFEIAVSGRPGPVLVDIPMDVQREEIELPPPCAHCAPAGNGAAAAPDPPSAEAAAFVGRLTTRLRSAQRPLILAGGGIRSSGEIEAFRRLARLLQVPVVNSLMAVDALPYGDPLRVGMIGSYGNRWANHVAQDADLMLVLGSRLDIRQTGADTAAFQGQRTIMHVDVEPGELNNRVVGCDTLVADLGSFLHAALSLAGATPFDPPRAWNEQIETLRRRWPDVDELPGIAGINPNAFIHRLAASSPAEVAAFVSDVGQHQMWAAQSLELRADQRFLNSGGMGSMGFGLPAAIGASFAAGSRPIVLIAGDGGFQCNIQELETVRRNRLPLKIVILDNACHGMVRQFQESYFEGRYQSTMWGYSAPDFVRVAEAYGIAARGIEQPDEIDSGLHWLWSRPDEPMLLHVAIDRFTNAYPKLAFGRPMTEMEPFATPLGMEST